MKALASGKLQIMVREPKEIMKDFLEEVKINDAINKPEVLDYLINTTLIVLKERLNE